MAQQLIFGCPTGGSAYCIGWNYDHYPQGNDAWCLASDVSGCSVSFRCGATAAFTDLHGVKRVLHTIKLTSMLQLFQNVVVGLVYSKNPISALLQGRTFGSGCVWVKLVWNQGLPHTKPQWRPLRREKKGKKSPWPHQCLISKPVFNNSIMIFPQLERKGVAAMHLCSLSWAALRFSQGFPKHYNTVHSEPSKGIPGNLKDTVRKENLQGWGHRLWLAE